MSKNLEQVSIPILNENQIHQCQDFQGFCMNIDCDSLLYCQLCYKKFHRKHSKHCTLKENVEELLQNKLNDYKLQISELENLSQKVQSINQYFKNTIEEQQNEINQILQFIRSLQFIELQHQAQVFKQIYHNKDVNSTIINIELKQYLEQINDIEVKWNSQVQVLKNKQERKQKIYFYSEDSGYSSSSSSEEIVNDTKEEEDNLKIKQFVFVEKDSNQQQESQEIQDQKNDQQKKEEQITDIQKQQQLENVVDEDYLWKFQLSQELIYDANQLVLNNQNNQALKTINSSLELCPNNLDALEYKGFVLHLLKRYKEAIVISDQVLNLDNRRYQAQNCKGKSLMSLFQFQEAIVCFDKVISVKPNLTEASLGKALCLQKLKKYIQSIDCAKNVSENSQQFKFLKLSLIGESLYRLHKYEEAFKFTSESLTINQNDVQLNSIHCFVLIQQKKFEDALIHLEVLFDNSLWEVVLLQCSILRWLKRFEEALKKCQQALNLTSFKIFIQNEKNLIQQKNSDDQTYFLFISKKN